MTTAILILSTCNLKIVRHMVVVMVTRTEINVCSHLHTVARCTTTVPPWTGMILTEHGVTQNSMLPTVTRGGSALARVSIGSPDTLQVHMGC